MSSQPYEGYLSAGERLLIKTQTCIVSGSGWQLPPIKIDPMPGRNIEVITIDAAGVATYGKVSSYIARSMCSVALWRDKESET